MDTFIKTILYDPIIGKIIATLVGIIIINLLVRFLQRMLSSRLETKEIRYKVRRGLSFFGYLAIVLLIIGVFSNQLSSFTVALGVAGAGIAFALQEIIASVAGWIALSFAQFYTIGDRVQLGGIKGDVIDIGVLRTTVMEIGEWVKADQYNGRIVRIANSFVFKEPVYNYSADFPFVWDEISLPIKYGSDHNLARKLILSAADNTVGEYVATAQKHWKEMRLKYSVENAIVEPTVFLIATDNWMEFTLRYVVEFSKRRGTKDLLYTRILDDINQTDGKVSMASATFQLVQAPPLDVRLRNE
ncbi:MAG: mechanosensitive ion channel [Anaerolineaceae bacterium]|nr:mechanosensitive ion channel [Anaerolineaceae bacterium]